MMSVTTPWVALLAGSLLGNQAQDEVRAESAERWIERLSDPDPGARESARIVLGSLGRRARPALERRRAGSDLDLGHRISILLSQDRLRRQIPCEIAGEFPEAARILLSGTSDERLELIAAMRRHPECRSLLRLLLADPDPEVLLAVDEALLLLDDQTGAPALLSRFSAGCVPNVGRAIELLKNHRDAGTVSDAALLRALDMVPEEIRRSVLLLAAERDVRLPLRNEWIERALEDEHPFLQEAAITLIRRGARSEFVPALRKLLDRADPSVLSSALLALRSLGVPLSEETLDRFLRHGHPFVRIAALDFLGEAASADLPRLLPFLKDPHRSLRERVLPLLWKVGHRSILPTLLDFAFDEKDSVLRERVVEFLRRDPEWSGERLRQEMSASDPFRRATAVALYWGLAAPDRISILSPLLADAHLEVRRAVFDVLEGSDRAEVGKAMETLLHEEDLHLRFRSLVFMARKGSSVALQGIRVLAEDAESPYRTDALIALLEVEEVVDRACVRRALQEESSSVRRSVLRILRERGVPLYEPRALAFLEQGDRELREMTIGYLNDYLRTHGDRTAIGDLVMAYDRAADSFTRISIASLIAQYGVAFAGDFPKRIREDVMKCPIGDPDEWAQILLPWCDRLLFEDMIRQARQRPAIWGLAMRILKSLQRRLGSPAQATARDALEALDRPENREELARLLSEAPWEIARLALDLLSSQERGDLSTLLIPALAHRDPRVRRDILAVLNEKSSRVFRAIQERLEDEDPSVRLEAVQALLRLGASEARQTLNTMHTGDECAWVRSRCETLLAFR